jgi:hypothetical protein
LEQLVEQITFRKSYQNFARFFLKAKTIPL